MKKEYMPGTIMAFATYKPKPGKEAELQAIVRKHSTTLRELELITNRSSYLAQAEDGTIIEVFEWNSSDTVNAAHQHPAIIDLWEKMTLIADFVPMNSIREGSKPFPGFKIID
jgi:hypothetical protein